MLRRKRRKRVMGKLSIIYISGIIGLSAMGIGYASWSGNLNIDTWIKTGYTKARIEEINSLNSGDGEWISLRFSEGNQTLYVEGQVYPEFNRNIPLKIIDEGSVPSMLKDLYLINDTGNTTLTWGTRDIYNGSNSNIDENIIELLRLNINPSNNIIERDYWGEDEILNLQEQINQYNTEGDYKFKYEILLEQSL